MFITDTVALKLSQQPDADKFAAAHNEGILCFPIVSSVKIMRKKTEDSTAIFYAVDCEEQRYESAATTSTFDLVKLLPRQSHSGSVEQPADTFVAAMLADIRASAFYPLSVRYAQQPVPQTVDSLVAAVGKSKIVCNYTRVLALVLSTKPS